MTFVPKAQSESASTDDEHPFDNHQGDVRAAIMKLLKDCQHLREQLAVTEFAMSRGLTRGWRRILSTSENELILLSPLVPPAETDDEEPPLL